uniref:Uncharacterized protein n=1 Tax=Sus scrofa TaxID=9823 RepID=A0A8D1P2J7_PIG
FSTSLVPTEAGYLSYISGSYRGWLSSCLSVYLSIYLSIYPSIIYLSIAPGGICVYNCRFLGVTISGSHLNVHPQRSG